MATTQYIGSRYVPILADPVEWSSTKSYEPLTIVTHEGNSYTSRQYVPVGIDITNNNYWALTGNYDAQIEQYRRETAQSVATNKAYTDAAVAQVNDWLTVAQSQYGAKPFAFETVADMQSSYNLFYNGAICHTNGFHTSGDGGGAWYIITTSGTANNIDVFACGNWFAHLVMFSNEKAPEMFGAYGDNSHDDSAAIQYVIDNFDDIYLPKQYYITQPLNITKDQTNIHGFGYIRSESDCFVLDGRNHITISNLRLAPKRHGIVVKTTSKHSNFNLIYDMYIYGTNGAGQCGIYIEETGGYITEQYFRNCIMWNFDYGIYATSEGAHQLSDLFFEHCDTENSKIAGQYLKNAENVWFTNSRHVEAVSLKFVTVGVCGLFIYGFAMGNGMLELSNQTNGMIIGRFRTGGIYNTTPGFFSAIVNGCVVPQTNSISGDRLSPPSDIDLMPATNYTQIINKFNITNNIKIRFNSGFFGGRNKINDIYLRLVANKTFTFEWGTSETATQTKTIGPLSATKQLHIFWAGSGDANNYWYVEEMKSNITE